MPQSLPPQKAGPISKPTDFVGIVDIHTSRVRNANGILAVRLPVSFDYRRVLGYTAALQDAVVKGFLSNCEHVLMEGRAEPRTVSVHTTKTTARGKGKKESLEASSGKGALSAGGTKEASTQADDTLVQEATVEHSTVYATSAGVTPSWTIRREPVKPFLEGTRELEFYLLKLNQESWAMFEVDVIEHLLIFDRQDRELGPMKSLVIKAYIRKRTSTLKAELLSWIPRK